MSYHDRESLSSYFKNLYGEEIYRNVRTLDKLKQKTSILINNLTFLKKCRNEKILPDCVKVKKFISSSKARRIFHKTEVALLRERIGFTRYQLHQNTEQVRNISDYLKSSIQESDWLKVNNITNKQAEKSFQLSKEKHTNKFDKFASRQRHTPLQQTLDPNKVVINLSNRKISSDTLSVLSKGLNFAITPKVIPKERIIIGIENAIRTCPNDIAEEIRIETAQILKRSKPPPRNLTKGELMALKELHKDKELLILPADKGNATVLLTRLMYNEKMEALLSDPTYKPVNKDLTKCTENNI